MGRERAPSGESRATPESHDFLRPDGSLANVIRVRPGLYLYDCRAGDQYAEERRTMSAPTNSTISRLFTSAHRLVYKGTGGRLGGRLGQGSILLLTKTGRRSMGARTTPLLYREASGGWIVVASNGGADKHPAWWVNLGANSHGTVQVKKERREVVAAEVIGDERVALWRRMVAVYADYEKYAKGTARSIPVVRLSPAT